MHAMDHIPHFEHRPRPSPVASRLRRAWFPQSVPRGARPTGVDDHVETEPWRSPHEFMD